MATKRANFRMEARWEPVCSPGFSRPEPPEGGTTCEPLQFIVPMCVRSLEVEATRKQLAPPLFEIACWKNSMHRKLGMTVVSR
ncbi:MAG: hypothetical protein O2960_19000 [Verrucomicrobia bacterium]|nr:hypothetical protein [Verrucomicrobiota bacterium]